VTFPYIHKLYPSSANSLHYSPSFPTLPTSF
jgi:hypothetical protein